MFPFPVLAGKHTSTYAQGVLTSDHWGRKLVIQFMVVRVAALTAAFTLLIGAASAASLNVLFETDEDAGRGAEVFLGSYATLEDLLVNPSSSGFLDVDLASSFSISGFAYDGQYRVLFETDEDAGRGAEVFLGSYATLEDLLVTTSSSGFLDVDLASSFSIAGFAQQKGDTPNVVPLPATFWLMFAGLGILGIHRRRRLTAVEYVRGVQDEPRRTLWR
jgi:hypothetical protein